MGCGWHVLLRRLWEQVCPQTASKMCFTQFVFSLSFVASSKEDFSKNDFLALLSSELPVLNPAHTCEPIP